MEVSDVGFFKHKGLMDNEVHIGFSFLDRDIGFSFLGIPVCK